MKMRLVSDRFLNSLVICKCKDGSHVDFSCDHDTFYCELVSREQVKEELQGERNQPLLEHPGNNPSFMGILDIISYDSLKNNLNCETG